MNNFNLTEWALGHRAVVLFLIIVVAIAGVFSFTKLGQLEDPKFSVPSMTATVIWPGRDRTADPGRGAEPHGEEVRAARPLREGRHLCAPGLRRHDDHREGRHLAQGPAGSLVPGAQEVLRPQARAARRRDRPDLQRRVRRRLLAALCRQGRRHRARGAVRHLRGHQAPPAQGAERQEGRPHGQAGPEGLRGVLARAPGRARHHAAGHRREPEEPERDAARRLDRHQPATASSCA